MRYKELGPDTRPPDEIWTLAGEPQLWAMDLRDGSQFTVITHAYCIEGSDLVFSLLFEGTPPFEIESLRIPIALMPEDFEL